ncbi:hypothetical protein OEB99_18930 [Actinotalea sp. M2MS4P-6]|uniref:hypothetical protein n=1 Tax=Actinotalea sp. M2MS4P-6 TaxID=2983762 RepID=UPI0021E37AEA|nr:hypothetical protein [Actinotalea sp. M2MS4P-6]MCV2396390.1 hypothetical protein [Actinotalea sp. M2MS4P-6]
MSELRRPVYRGASWSAFAVLVLIAIQLVVFAVWPPPGSAEAWLDVFARSPLLGLINADALYLVSTVLLIPVYLGLAVRLAAEEPALALGGVTAGLVSVVTFVPSNVAAELWDLAGRASAGAEREVVIGAVEATLARSSGSAFLVSYVLGGVALLLFALALRRTGVWGPAAWRTCGVAGVLMLVPSTVGVVGVVFSLVSLVPWVWFCVLAVRRLGDDAAACLLPARPVGLEDLEEPAEAGRLEGWAQSPSRSAMPRS